MCSSFTGEEPVPKPQQTIDLYQEPVPAAAASINTVDAILKNAVFSVSGAIISRFLRKKASCNVLKDPGGCGRLPKVLW